MSPQRLTAALCVPLAHVEGPMKITALRQLTGDYGVMAPGESQDVRDDIAKSLITRGLALPYTEIKAIVPAEQPSPVVQATTKTITNKAK